VACIALAPRGATNEDPALHRTFLDLDDETSVSYLRSGDPAAPRVIYVHGTPGSATAWAAYLRDPIERFEGIAIDRFGFGESKPNGPVPSLKEQARAIAPFLVERGGQWPILVGHSFGAPIICRAAVDNPDRVGGLVIVCGSMDPTLEKVAWYQRVGDFWFVARLLPQEIRNANRELFPFKKELEELQPLLAKIACPIVIVHATDDWLVDVANVDYMREVFPENRIYDEIILEKGNHFLIWNSQPVIRDAIRRLGSPAARGLLIDHERSLD
jgi:pimeloyl-ACP methyl ester carboxylesterase